MTKLSFTGSLQKDVRESLEDHIDKFYANPDLRMYAIVELGVVQTTTLGTAAADNEEPAVKVRVTMCEVFAEDRRDVALRAIEALYRERTQAGTLDEGSAEGQALKHLAGLATVAEPDYSDQDDADTTPERQHTE